jgi:hypothetical protein
MNNLSSETTSKGQEKSENGFLRLIALIALIVGAIGSLVFMFRAGEHTPRLLLVIFTFWVLSPFAGIFWAHLVSRRWNVSTRITLYFVAIIVSLGSLAVYSGLIDVKPARSANAFLFVIVPPVSLVFSVVIVVLARVLSGRSSHS